MCEIFIYLNKRISSLDLKFDLIFNFVQKNFNVELTKKNTILKIKNSFQNVNMTYNFLKIVLNLLKIKNEITLDDLNDVFHFIKFKNFDKKICLNYYKEVVSIKNCSQFFFYNSIQKNNITFAIGPAGTGKTYLAVAMAALSLKNKLYEKIIFTRPIIEAGENLGFLPGSVQDKINPYLKPLFDAMCDFLGLETFNKYVEKGLIEMLPLAYMRGRSLNNCFIVLDEAQNTTIGQLKMFLTRLGFNSKMVVTGDLTQIDLPSEIESGLRVAFKILDDVPGVGIINFKQDEVIRHKLIKTILNLFNYYEKDKKGK